MVTALRVVLMSIMCGVGDYIIIHRGNRELVTFLNLSLESVPDPQQ